MGLRTVNCIYYMTVAPPALGRQSHWHWQCRPPTVRGYYCSVVVRHFKLAAGSVPVRHWQWHWQCQCVSTAAEPSESA